MTTAILSTILALTVAVLVALIRKVWQMWLLQKTHSDLIQQYGKRLQDHQRYIEVLRKATLVSLERHNYEWPPSLEVSSAEYLKSDTLAHDSSLSIGQLEKLGLPNGGSPVRYEQ